MKPFTLTYTLISGENETSEFTSAEAALNLLVTFVESAKAADFLYAQGRGSSSCAERHAFRATAFRHALDAHLENL